jgi:uncharacterized protein (DUF302 family)
MEFSMPNKKTDTGKRKIWGMFAAGFLWGITFSFIIGTLFLRHSLIKTYVSDAGFKETVLKLTTKARSMKGWKVTSTACSVPQPKNGSKITVIKLCHGKYGAELMNDPILRKTAAMIPCSMAIYEIGDGSVVISRMNTSLLGTLLGGRAGRILSGQIAPEQEQMMEAIR